MLFSVWRPFSRRFLAPTRKLHMTICLRRDYTESEELDETEYKRLADHYFHVTEAHNCLIIQPYVKWGPKKLPITPEEQLSEAVALINTLPAWSVEDVMSIPLDNLDRKSLFKSGTMDRITGIVQGNSDITAIFINSGSLKKATVQVLQENFHRPILDRYKVIMQILKTHATSKHAKLQVALAELYYIKRKSEIDLMFRTYNKETLRLMFQEREQKIKGQIKELREQRHLLRQKRRKMDYPVVAVVGYTNSGKTSIIKALTGEESLVPKDQLFATLDVTVHEGFLPSGLQILYVDTVGFISDIPTNLIECFVATLEDALLADVILHVEDMSSKHVEFKRNHVLNTLKKLEKEAGAKDIMNKVVSVGNKCDLLVDTPPEPNILFVSAVKGTGLEELRHQLEDFILHITGRQKITIRVTNGGDEIRWLYKYATVLEEIPDQNDLQCVFAKVIITQANLQKFKHYYIAN